MARTAACFCVVLTLDTAAAFFGAALRETVFGAALFALTAGFAFAATFLAARSLTGLRAVAFAAVARFAFGLVDDFALTARFVMFRRQGTEEAQAFIEIIIVPFPLISCEIGRAHV